MKNLWNHSEARRFIREYKKLNYTSDIALRIYTSRLLGANKELVLHGGGNTSVKTVQRDIDGTDYNVICVKGSGWDLDSIEPEGLPAVKLDPLLKLRNKKTLSDEQMVSYQKRHLLDLKSPNPSVETFLHAFLPFKYVDHTHSNSILTLTNRKDGYKLCKKIFSDDRVEIVKYVMPGFDLAREVNTVYQKNPKINCLILMNHGIFTFANDAKESYDLMIKYISKAENYEKKLQSRKSKLIKNKKLFTKIESLLPMIRGMFEVDGNNKYILNYRTNKNILDFMNLPGVDRFLDEGTVTPDHVIRIKPFPMYIKNELLHSEDVFKKTLYKEFARYKNKYINYFKKNNTLKTNIMLNPYPCIIYLQGLGMVSIGSNLSSSKIAGDIAEQNINVIKRIERTTNFKTISKKELFDVEYWSLEQAKINKKQKDLEGNIVVITGGTGIIGRQTSKIFRENGAEVIVLDISKEKVNEFNAMNNGLAIECDVRDRKQIDSAFNQIIRSYGGIDILVSNAGTAPQGRIGDIEDKLLRQSFEDNFFSHQNCASKAVEIMIQQNLKGCLLFNISKQSVNPGKNFGPYGLPKTALLNLCKQYALDYGEYGIRSNGINADRIVSGILNAKMIKKRAKARNISTKEYMSGNLLQEEVKAEDVAKGFLHLALSNKTTGAVITIDGGNIAASLR